MFVMLKENVTLFNFIEGVFNVFFKQNVLKV